MASEESAWNEFRHFQDDLDALKERLLAMGGLAEERVTRVGARR